MAATEPAGDFEVLLRRLFAGIEHAADARGVDGERLFHEHVAALRHGIFQVDRPKRGRRSQEHDSARTDCIDRLLVGIEADELTVRRDIDLLGHWVAVQPRDTALHAVCEKIGGGDQFCGPRGLQGLADRPVAAAAAAHQGNLDRVVLAGIGPLRDSARQRGPGQGSAGLLKELATC